MSDDFYGPTCLPSSKQAALWANRDCPVYITAYDSPERRVHLNSFDSASPRVSLRHRKSYFTLLSNFPLIEFSPTKYEKLKHFSLRRPRYLWWWHTSHKSWHWFSFRSQLSLQGSRHCEKKKGRDGCQFFKEPATSKRQCCGRWGLPWLGAGWQTPHSATSPARSTQPVTPLFVTRPWHIFKAHKQSPAKANTGLSVMSSHAHPWCV